MATVPKASFVVLSADSVMVGTDLHLNNTMGCAFVGVLFAVTLYGCSLAQTMFYFREYPKDKLFLKILVTSLWLFDTARTGLDVAFMWYWLVTNHGNPVNLAILPNTFTAEFFLAALTIAVVQIYFIHTIGRLLTGRWYRTPYSLALLAMSLVSFVGGVVSVERINLNTDATVAVIDATVPASIQTITAFITDMIITLSLCYPVGLEDGLQADGDLDLNAHRLCHPPRYIHGFGPAGAFCDVHQHTPST